MRTPSDVAGIWIQLFRRPLLPLSLAVLCTSGLSLLVGFVLVSPAQGALLVIRHGYWFITALFCSFCLCLARVLLPSLRGWLARERRDLRLPLLLLLACVLIALGDRVAHKVLFDEHTLLATAEHLNTAREVATPTAGLFRDGHHVNTEAFLDKRPYFFAYLVSLLNGAFGGRESNGFLLNLLLLPVLVFSTHGIVSKYAGSRGGLLSVALLCTLPVLSQSATSAGMELHNLAFLSLSVWIAIQYLESPRPLSLSLLCLTAPLLAQCRYESVLFVPAIIVVILLGWHRAGRPLLSWGAVLAPLLLIPWAWHHRHLSVSRELWQLGPGQTERFSLEYLGANLRGALHFFFNPGTDLPNSPQLTLLGLASLLALLILLLRRKPAPVLAGGEQARLALGIFGLFILLNLALLQLYYWARLDEYEACRFSLPVYWGLALCVPLALQAFPGHASWTWRAAWWCVCAGALLHTLPTRARALYTERNLMAREVEWELRTLAGARETPLLVISNKSTLPWLLAHVPSRLLTQGDALWQSLPRDGRGVVLGTVLVTQGMKPSSAEGDFAVVPDDVVPSYVELREVATHREGARLNRLSVVYAVRPVPSADAAR